jgi:hypothetical protein
VAGHVYPRPSEGEMGLEPPGIQLDEWHCWRSLGILPPRRRPDHATHTVSAASTENAQRHHQSVIQECRLLGGKSSVPGKLRCARTGPCLAQHASVWIFQLGPDMIMHLEAQILYMT